MSDPPDQPHAYARDVADAIDGHGPDDPVALWQLHEAIDWRERDMIGVDDLNAILGWLASAGRLRELPGHGYVDASHGVGDARPTPVTGAEWTEARAEYHRWFAGAYAEMRERLSRPGGSVVPKLAVSVPISRRSPSAAETAAADALADAVTAAAIERGMIAVVAETEVRGRAIVTELLGIHGQDGQRMLAIAAEVVRTHGPAGSTVTVEAMDLPMDLPSSGPLVPVVRVTLSGRPQMSGKHAAALVEATRLAVQAEGIEVMPLGGPDGSLMFAGSERDDGPTMVRLVRRALDRIGATDATLELEEHDQAWLMEHL